MLISRANPYRANHHVTHTNQSEPTADKRATLNFGLQVEFNFSRSTTSANDTRRLSTPFSQLLSKILLILQLTDRQQKCPTSRPARRPVRPSPTWCPASTPSTCTREYVEDGSDLISLELRTAMSLEAGPKTPSTLGTIRLQPMWETAKEEAVRIGLDWTRTHTLIQSNPIQSNHTKKERISFMKSTSKADIQHLHQFDGIRAED